MPQSALKASHLGFFDSINAIFFARIQSFISFSRAIGHGVDKVISHRHVAPYKLEPLWVSILAQSQIILIAQLGCFTLFSMTWLCSCHSANCGQCETRMFNG